MQCNVSILQYLFCYYKNRFFKVKCNSKASVSINLKNLLKNYVKKKTQKIKKIQNSLNDLNYLMSFATNCRLLIKLKIP